MLGEQRQVLYVGKAKDLKTRLMSYPRANPNSASRKILRMLHFVRSIQFESVENEAAALLRENALLRKHRPPFNTLNVNPENYFFVRLKQSGNKVELAISPRGPEHDLPKGVEYFGAFRNRRALEEGFRALLRMLWLAHGEVPTRFEYPVRLVKERGHAGFAFQLSPVWLTLIRRYFKGNSNLIIARLAEGALAQESIPPFMYAVVQEDIEKLKRFYNRGPHHNRKMKRHCRIKVSLIAQDELDDLVVKFRYTPPENRKA